MSVVKGPITVINIGNHSVKVLVVDLTKKTPQVLFVNTLLFEHSPQLDNTNLRAQTVEKAIKALSKTYLSHVCVLLPNNVVFTRYVTLPHIHASKMDKIVRFEAEQQIPFQINEVSWDYAIIPTDEQLEINVLISAIRNSEIEALWELFNRLNVKVKTFSTSAVAFYNLIKTYGGNADNVVLIDIGSDVTTVIITERNKTWSRNLLTGAEKLTERIAAQLGISPQEARAIRQDPALISAETTQPHVANTTKLFISEVAQEIKRTFSFYTSISHQYEVTKVFITGGFSHFHGIEQLMQEELGVATKVLNLEGNLQVSSQYAEVFRENANNIYPSLGLAASENTPNALSINLIPSSERDKRQFGNAKALFYKTIGIIILFLVIFLGNMLAELATKSQLSKLVKNKITQYEKFDKQINNIQHELNILHNRLEIIETKKKLKYAFATALKEISHLAPDNIWISSLYFENDGTLSLTGECNGNLADINRFKNTLVEGSIFSTVSIGEANIRSNASNNNIRVFSMKLQMKEFSE